MYYGRSVHRTEMRPDVARKQHGNYHSVARTVPVNFLMTYTIHLNIKGLGPGKVPWITRPLNLFFNVDLGTPYTFAALFADTIPALTASTASNICSFLQFFLLEEQLRSDTLCGF